MAEFDSEAAFFEKQFNYLKLKQIKTKLYKKNHNGQLFSFCNDIGKLCVHFKINIFSQCNTVYELFLPLLVFIYHLIFYRQKNI